MSPSSRAPLRRDDIETAGTYRRLFSGINALLGALLGVQPARQGLSQLFPPLVLALWIRCENLTLLSLVLTLYVMCNQRDKVFPCAFSFCHGYPRVTQFWWCKDGQANTARHYSDSLLSVFVVLHLPERANETGSIYDVSYLQHVGHLVTLGFYCRLRLLIIATGFAFLAVVLRLCFAMRLLDLASQR